MIYLFVILSPENFVHQFTYLVASKNKSKVHVSCQYIQSSRCCDIGKILKSEVEMKQPPPPLPKLP